MTQNALKIISRSGRFPHSQPASIYTPRLEGRNLDRYVIIKIQSQAQNGDIVAALIEDDVTLKYFYRTRNQIRLDSANPRYPSLIFKKSAYKSFRILGVMTGLVRKRHRAQ